MNQEIDWPTNQPTNQPINHLIVKTANQEYNRMTKSPTNQLIMYATQQPLPATLLVSVTHLAIGYPLLKSTGAGYHYGLVWLDLRNIRIVVPVMAASVTASQQIYVSIFR